MLYAVVFFRTLRIVEAVERTDEVARDSADSLERDISLFSAAAGALVADDARVTADRVVVNRMVDRAVSDAAVVHLAHNAFECVDIRSRVAVHFHIGDVTAVGQIVVGRFQTDLVRRGNAVVYGNMD